MPTEALREGRLTRNNPTQSTECSGTGHESRNSRRHFWFGDRCPCLSGNPRAVLQSL